MLRSNQRDFIVQELRTPQNVVAMFTRYGIDPPGYAAVEKWFQRGKVPSEWMFQILALMELEQGRPVSLMRYVDSL